MYNTMSTVEMKFFWGNQNVNPTEVAASLPPMESSPTTTVDRAAEPLQSGPALLLTGFNGNPIGAGLGARTSGSGQLGSTIFPPGSGCVSRFEAVRRNDKCGIVFAFHFPSIAYD